jgi:DNA-binding CsgD family transcriptional regulator/N-acetylneuraminic acid mutarotase
MPELNEALSEREREILKLVATGASNKEIAQKLSISANTVKVHLRNIFTKIGADSRTAAAMYAVQRGLAASQGAESDAKGGEPSAAEDGAVSGALAVPPRRGWRTVALWAGGLAIAALLAAWLIFRPSTPPGPAAVQTVESEPARWQEKAELSLPRQGLGVAVYRSQIYAFGGETAQGVTAAVERYDPQSDRWASRAAMPIAAADMAAGAVAGKIYLPGGRLGDGTVSRGLQIYDPDEDRWSQGADLPVALSAYALAVLEGRLYLFGGWDGREYSNRVLIYDPEEDVWSEGAPSPARRAFSAAVTVDGEIHILGGRDQSGVLSINEVYRPDSASPAEAWVTGSPLPTGRFALGAANVVDIIYLIGGEGAEGEQVIPLEYIPRDDRWLELTNAPLQPLSHFGVVLLDTSLYLVGGRLGDAPTGQNLAYQAIYTISLPSVVK